MTHATPTAITGSVISPDSSRSPLSSPWSCWCLGGAFCLDTCGSDPLNIYCMDSEWKWMFSRKKSCTHNIEWFCLLFSFWAALLSVYMKQYCRFSNGYFSVYCMFEKIVGHMHNHYSLALWLWLSLKWIRVCWELTIQTSLEKKANIRISFTEITVFAWFSSEHNNCWQVYII